MQRSDLVFGPIWFVAAAKAKAKRQQADDLRLCNPTFSF